MAHACNKMADNSIFGGISVSRSTPPHPQYSSFCEGLIVRGGGENIIVKKISCLVLRLLSFPISDVILQRSPPAAIVSGLKCFYTRAWSKIIWNAI